MRSIASECSRLFNAGADAVVVELLGAEFADAESRSLFVVDVEGKRSQSCYLHVRTMDIGEHARLGASEHSADWLMPFAGCAEGTPRRSLDVRSPLKP